MRFFMVLHTCNLTFGCNRGAALACFPFVRPICARSPFAWLDCARFPFVRLVRSLLFGLIVPAILSGLVYTFTFLLSVSLLCLSFVFVPGRSSCGFSCLFVCSFVCTCRKTFGCKLRIVFCSFDWLDGACGLLVGWHQFFLAKPRLPPCFPTGGWQPRPLCFPPLGFARGFARVFGLCCSAFSALPFSRFLSFLCLARAVRFFSW